MNHRRPVSAPSRATLPTLTALLAGSSLSACQPPQCGDSRADELVTHGQQGSRALTRGEFSEGVTQLGVGLGVAQHPAQSVAGAMMPVTTLPPTPSPPTPSPPVPVTNPSETQLQPPGGAMRVLPAPPPTPRVPPRRPVVPAPNPQMRTGGAVSAVQFDPVDAPHGSAPSRAVAR